MYRGLRGHVEDDSTDHSDMPLLTTTPPQMQFTIGVTTTWSQCSDSTDAPHHTNSTVGGNCVVGCTTGPELASGNTFRVPPGVCKKDGNTVLARYFIACPAMCCWTSINQAPIGVSEDCEDILDSTSCRRAWAVGVESASHLALSGFAIGQWELLCRLTQMCEDNRCCDWATCDLSLWSQECTNSTSGDQCKVMCAVGDAESAESFRGSFPNCLTVLSEGDDPLSVVSQDWGGIAFRESSLSRRSRARRCHLVHLVLGIQRLSCQERSVIFFRLQSLVLSEKCAF